MLTGKTRHRIGLRGRLVLQVEYWGAGGGSGWQIPKLQKRWRDADIHDLQDLTGSLTLWEANAKVPPMPQPPKREHPNTNPPPSYTRPPPPPPPPPPKEGRPQSRYVGDWDKQDRPIVPQPRSQL